MGRQAAVRGAGLARPSVMSVFISESSNGDMKATDIERALTHIVSAASLLRGATRTCSTGAESGAGEMLDCGVSDPSVEAIASPMESLDAALLHRQIQEIHENDLLTNDIVEIRGVLAGKEHTLKINGALSIKLGLREYVVLVILAGFSIWQKKAGKKPRSRFISPAAVAEQVARLGIEGHLPSGFWKTPIYSDIHKVIEKLRKRLSNPRLIQTGQRRSGHRLSTPSVNLLVEDLELLKHLDFSAASDPRMDLRRMLGGKEGETP